MYYIFWHPFVDKLPNSNTSRRRFFSFLGCDVSSSTYNINISCERWLGVDFDTQLCALYFYTFPLPFSSSLPFVLRPYSPPFSR